MLLEARRYPGKIKTRLKYIAPSQLISANTWHRYSASKTTSIHRSLDAHGAIIVLNRIRNRRSGWHYIKRRTAGSSVDTEYLSQRLHTLNTLNCAGYTVR